MSTADDPQARTPPIGDGRSVADVLAAHRPRRSKRLLRLGLVGLGVLALVGGGVRLAKQRAADAAPRYQTVEVARGDLRVTVTATGTLQATTTVEVGAEVTGRVLEVRVEPNDHVAKGQLLAVIDPEQLRASADEAQAQLASAEASIRTARATRVEARAAADRAVRESKEGLLAQKDLEAAVAAADRAEAGVASAIASASLARATLTLAKSKLDKTEIFAPIDGMVLARLIEPGQTVTAGFTTPVLFRIAEDLTHMRLDVDVDEADVGRAREGQEASFTVEAYPEHPFASRVLLLLNDPKNSQNVVTYQARLAVDNGERLLRPGMTATAVIVTDTKRNVVVVPNAALRFAPPAKSGFGGPQKRAGDTRDKDKKTVYVVGDDKQLHRVVVKVGATDGTNTELVEGGLPEDCPAPGSPPPKTPPGNECGKPVGLGVPVVVDVAMKE